MVVEKSTVKLIIDTDGVADDVQAISLALQHPNAEVLAFTTVHGCTGALQAAANVARTLRANGIKNKIPIYQGAENPLVVTEEDHLTHAADIFGADGIGGEPNAFPKVLPEDFKCHEPEPASMALIRLTKEHPDAILVCLGPLTNIALALKLSPTFASQPKKLVIMGGNYYGIGNVGGSSAEFNFFGDPEAAYTVFREMKSEIVCIPWEASFLEGAHHQEIVDFHAHLAVYSELGRFLSTATKKIRTALAEKNKQFPFCDEITMAVAIDPDAVVLKEKKLWATVELNGKFTRGQVVIDWRNSVWDSTLKDYSANPTGHTEDFSLVTFVSKYDVRLIADWMMKSTTGKFTNN